MNSNPTDLINIIIGASSQPTTPTLGEDEELQQIGSSSSVAGANNVNNQGTNRYSYRAAIYRSDAQGDLG